MSKKTIMVLCCVIAILVVCVNRENDRSSQKDDFNDVKYVKFENFNRTSKVRSKKSQFGRPEVTQPHYLIDQLYETRNSRRGVNAIVLCDADGQLNEDMLFSEGFSRAEVEVIELLLNDLRTQTFTLIRQHTRLIDADQNLYRTDRYDDEFADCMTLLYAELTKSVSAAKAKFVMESFPFENFEGFSGKYSVDFKIMPINDPSNPYNEYAKTYWIEHGISTSSGTSSWSQACKLTGPMIIDGNGHLVIDEN